MAQFAAWALVPGRTFHGMRTESCVSRSRNSVILAVLRRRGGGVDGAVRWPAVVVTDVVQNSLKLV